MQKSVSLHPGCLPLPQDRSAQIVVTLLTGCQSDQSIMIARFLQTCTMGTKRKGSAPDLFIECCLVRVADPVPRLMQYILNLCTITDGIRHDVLPQQTHGAGKQLVQAACADDLFANFRQLSLQTGSANYNLVPNRCR